MLELTVLYATVLYAPWHSRQGCSCVRSSLTRSSWHFRSLCRSEVTICQPKLAHPKLRGNPRSTVLRQPVGVCSYMLDVLVALCPALRLPTPAVPQTTRLSPAECALAQKGGGGGVTSTLA